MKRQHERRIRGGVIMAELGPEELDDFLAECQRQRRTTGLLGGRIIAEWLKTRGHSDGPEHSKQVGGR